MNASIDITNALPFLLGASGAGVLVVLVAQAIKKVFGLNSGHVIHLMVVAVSVALSAAQYILQLKHLPLEVLGISSTTVYGVSQFVYNEAPRVTSFLKRIQLADVNPAPAAAPAVASAPVAAGAEAAPIETPVAPVEPAPAAANDFNL